MGSKVVLCSEQKCVYSDMCDTLWVLSLPFVPVLTSHCMSVLSKSKIKLNRVCYLENIYSYVEVLDYFVDKCCGNVSLLRKVSELLRDLLNCVKV